METLINNMKPQFFLEKLSDYLSELPHRSKLFEVIDEITKKDESLSYFYCLESAFHILTNMANTFIERRETDFFYFLFSHLGSQASGSKAVCRVNYLLHEIAFSFQKKQVLGFLIEIKGIYGEIESIQSSFVDRHKNILLIEHATLPFFYIKENKSFLYFEIQKKEGNFIPDEIVDLKESLEGIGFALPSRWKTPIPTLESSLKMLRWLMKEVTHADIPHVLINLDEQRPDGISFFVLLCQHNNSNQDTFAPFILRPDIEVKLRLKENSVEGIVLKIDLPNIVSLSLIEGRKHIASLLNQSIGEFRDVNGGLLEQIENNFDHLAQNISNSNGLLRTFFDSISPEEIRAICAPRILKEIYFEMLKILQEHTRDNFSILEREEWIGVIIWLDKSLKKEWKINLASSLPRVGFSQINHSNEILLSVFLPIPSCKEKEIFKEQVNIILNTLREQKDSKKVLRLCTTSRFNSFDPRTGTEEETSYLHKMLFEGLMRISPSGTVEYAIAEKVEISDDGKKWRFYLRKSLWSNGEPLTAHDFLYSWKMILKRKDLAPLSYLFDYIKNAQEVKQGTKPINDLGVKIVDDYILDVELLTPCIPFLEICALTLFSPICRAIDLKQPSWMEAEGETYICNGPFHLEKKDANGGVVLRKNPQYWEAHKVQLEHVTIPFVSLAEGEKMFLEREIDAILFYFYKDPSQIAVKGREIQEVKGGIFMRYLCLNCSKPPFHNKKIRKAIALVLNRNKITEFIPQKATPSSSFLSPLFFRKEQDRAADQNIHEAQELLIQALAEDPSVRNTIFGKKICLVKQNEILAKIICEQINEALHLGWGISLFEKQDVKSYFEDKKNFDISIFSWKDRICDPGYFLETFSCSNNYANLSCWTNAKIQMIIEKLKRIRTQNEKEQLVLDAENILWEEMPLIPLFHTDSISLHYPDIKGLHSSTLHQFDIRFSWKD